MSLTDNAAHVVQVTFTGPMTATITVNPGATQTVSLTKGAYTVTGKAFAANVSFAASTWSLADGCNYALQVITLP